jgi:hypothetical protein
VCGKVSPSAWITTSNFYSNPLLVNVPNQSAWAHEYDLKPCCPAANMI